MSLMTIKVRFEQSVYGSFPFWNRGYGLLARSAGCRPEWLAALKTVCQRYGEPPAGLLESDAFFAIRLERGPWMMVGVYPQGRDDQDRPGALAFHALFVGHWAYCRSGADPFAFTDALRRDWSRADLDTTLPTGCLTIPRWGLGPPAPHPATLSDERLIPIIRALVQKRRVAVQATEPIETLARVVWQALSLRVRLRSSVATWAFDNANRFDLAALPKVAGVAHGASDLILAREDAQN
jgi:hypothetical protein